MKYRKADLIKIELIVLFISTLLTAILIPLIAVTQVPRYLVPFIWVAFIIFFNYILIVKPEKILLRGYLQLRTPTNLQEYVSKFLAKYIEKSISSRIYIHVIEDTGYSVMFFADLRSVHLVFTSKVVSDWNEIDIESALLYLSVLQGYSSPLRDTGILVLATIAERFIITSFVGAALIHLVRAQDDDVKIDHDAITKMKYSIGYINMLTKLHAGRELLSKLPASFGMNAVGDIAKDSIQKSMYDVHESINARIEAVGKS